MVTIQTPPINGAVPTSLLELGARKVAGFAARRKRERTGAGRRALSFVGEVLGTVLALACVVVAAFAAGFVIGFLVSGLALLLLDFKVTVVRRSRAGGQRR
jgi:fructose-specific phosphotransferase system IIC component